MLNVFIAVVTGLINVAVFPKIDQPWLAVICLLPLFWLARKERPWRLFQYFWLAGFIFRLGNLYWIIHVIQHYSSLKPVIASGIVTLLCIFMACFWGMVGLLIGWIRNRLNFTAAMIAAPFLWVVFEWLLNVHRFPWDLLGYSMYRYLPIAQVATIAGVYGLSWLIAAWNAAWALALAENRKYYLYSITAIVVVALIFGWWRISIPLDGPELKVGIVQGSFPQDVKINYDFAQRVNDTHIELTKALISTSHPDIIFWSESSTMFPILAGGEWTHQITELARTAHTPILLGSDAYVGDRVYNSSFLIDSNGTILPIRYSKMFLVPFGEYVPFQKLLFFAGKVVPEISDFTPGEYHTPFPLNGRKFAVNICFEVVFPQLARTFCKDGVSLLTTITNDAWFGKSSAPYQHFAMAVMRTIENRRYLVRAANTGISGIVDPYGRVIEKTDIFVQAVLSGKVRWVDEETFYTKTGDWILYLSMIVSVLVLIKGVSNGSRLKTNV